MTAVCLDAWAVLAWLEGLEAAELKGRHGISYADAFALATAIAHGAVLLTGDPEILAGPGEWLTEDLRP